MTAANTLALQQQQQQPQQQQHRQHQRLETDSELELDEQLSTTVGMQTMMRCIGFQAAYARILLCYRVVRNSAVGDFKECAI